MVIFDLCEKWNNIFTGWLILSNGELRHYLTNKESLNHKIVKSKLETILNPIFVHYLIEQLQTLNYEPDIIPKENYIWYRGFLGDKVINIANNELYHQLYELVTYI